MKKPLKYLPICALTLSAACSTPPGKSNNAVPDSGTAEDTGGSGGDASGSLDVGETADGSSSVGSACVNGGTDCDPGLICQSDEEARWNFCGAPTEPNCEEGFVGDNCGNCFQACTATEECPETMTCNGNFCVTGRTCREEQLPPP